MVRLGANVDMRHYCAIQWQLPVTCSNMARYLATLTAILFLCNIHDVSGVEYITETYTDSANNGEINHLVVHNYSGKIYVGAVNSIYQLTENLSLLKQVKTGPEEDNPNCRPLSGSECPFEARRTDSVNKALLLDYGAQFLITCSNLRQGECQKRLVSDISQTEEPITEPVVNFDTMSPVVMYIAPAVGNSKALYVASTYSTVGLASYRDKVPLISSRNLSTFDYLKSGIIDPGTKMLMRGDKNNFPIKYQAGFSSGGFSYFIAVQPNTTSNFNRKNVTKIMRVCQSDLEFTSYVEMPLKCSYNGVDYDIVQDAHVMHPGAKLARSLGISHLDQDHTDDVIFAVFTRAQRPQRPGVADEAQAPESALCVYPLRYVRQQFTSAIQDCFDGVGNTGPEHFKPIGQCRKQASVNIEDDYCGSHEINNPISGSPANSIAAQAAVVLSNTKATAIVTTTTHEFTVALIGTADGEVLKVVVENRTRAIHYETIMIQEGSDVNPDLAMDRSGHHVYVATGTTVSKVKMHQCDQYTTCDQCLQAQDPYCGWCSLENKCSLRSECPKADQPLQWLDYAGKQCTQILTIIPQQVHRKRDDKQKMILFVRNLPRPSTGDYECKFSGAGMKPRITTATRTDNAAQGNSTLQCETPLHNLFPDIPTGHDHVSVTLSIRMDNKDFVSKDFIFFDCGRHDSCSSCTTSEFSCTWCVEKHRCENEREKCGATDMLVTGRNVLGQTEHPGPEFCPRIDSSFNEILVANENELAVQVKAVHLERFERRDFRCIFSGMEGGGGERSVSAVYNAEDETITCDNVTFFYSGTKAEKLNIPFRIILAKAERKVFDNPNNIQVVVYKCELMATDCGTCLTRDDRYMCGWCTSDDTCTISSKCSNAPTNWLADSAICPDPRITSIHPRYGPLEGGTSLTIEGRNLGTIFDNIQGGVTVGDVQCVAIEDAYEPASTIVCETEATNEAVSEQVEVVISNQLRTQSEHDFNFVKPLMREFHPKQGPRSGGTEITIRGEYLNIGFHVTAYVMDKPCLTTNKITEFTVVCVTPMGDPEVFNADVTMSIDNARFRINSGSHSNDTFEYVHDPEVLSVNPMVSVPSGGTTMEVHGSRLDIIQKPKMVFYLNGKQFTSDCVLTSNATMSCKSPVISTLQDVTIKEDDPISISYGFILDDVTSSRNMTRDQGGLIKIYPDPEIETFENGVKNFQQRDYLTINGDYLILALTVSDYHVTIGEHSCEVTSVSPSQLNCAVPDYSKYLQDDKNPIVILRFGSNNITVGRLNFDTGSVDSSRFGGMPSKTIWTIIVVIVLCVAVPLIVIILVCLFMYRRQAKKGGMVQRRMQQQMDQLEARVAKECKEAFAELQTDMADIARDLSGHVGIPFRNYKDFAMKMMFPKTPADEHPVVRGLELEVTHRDDISKGLEMFDKLVTHRNFMLLFIRTLESQPDFNIPDKVNVASLISVTLHSRMEFYTEILKQLLMDLIEKSRKDGQRAKLLLRRTESVAEKMLANWFTILLHKFLTECAGEPLFMLFRAIKQQIDKGPVDMLTSEAKYSLSEDKLIRQSIEFKPISLRVIDMQTNHETLVKALDCDSISQVKEKILDALYKHAPFSNRPDRDELELEWQTGVKGRLILKDEDKTTRPEGGAGSWKKLNTLNHYAVTEGAVVALVPKQSSMYTLSLSHSGSNHHVSSAFKDSPSLSRSMSPDSRAIDTDSITAGTTYHLVKPCEVEDTKEYSSKMVSEIYLTRLLATKGSLQKFVDDLFRKLFNVNVSSNGRQSMHESAYGSPLPNQSVPLPIKYMFDFLDDQALHHSQIDPEVVHTWKSNSLPLRFWVNIVKNPDFVFDIRKSNIVDACLSVIAQTLMDSCSMSEVQLSKDSPSSKLLYAKDLPGYKNWVANYYQHIKQMPAISDQDMNAMLAEESRQHTNDFHTDAALYELYRYVDKYYDRLMECLEEDEFAKQYRLAQRLEQVHYHMKNVSYV